MIVDKEGRIFENRRKQEERRKKDVKVEKDRRKGERRKEIQEERCDSEQGNSPVKEEKKI